MGKVSLLDLILRWGGRAETSKRLCGPAPPSNVQVKEISSPAGLLAYMSIPPGAKTIGPQNCRLRPGTVASKRARFSLIQSPWLHGSRIVDGNLTQESGLYNHKDKLSQLYYIKNNPVTTTNRARKKKFRVHTYNILLHCSLEYDPHPRFHTS